MSGETVRTAGLLTPRKIAVQLTGFVIGILLLGWCVSIAMKGGGLERLADADPRLVVALAACSVVSLFVNGVSFWLVIRPVQQIRFWSLQWINLVVAVLNYAPIRLGLIARVAYHVRIDRMPLLRIGAWLAALGYTLALTLGACIAATIIRPAFDLLWAALLVGQLVLGGLLTWAVMGQSIVTRFGRGMEQMIGRPACLWGAIALRLVDIGAFVGRMACAVAILDLPLATPDVLLLGFAALALSLNPLGRMGFREIAVAFVAARLVSPEAATLDLESDMATLALVESAGEALVFIPLGAIALLWFRATWIRGPRPVADGDAATDDPDAA
jgi:hypothetical protein